MQKKHFNGSVTSFFRSPGELQERCHFSRWNTGAMQTRLQTDGTLPVALRRDAELTACGDWGAAGETVHQAEPGRGHAGRQAARWTHITRTQSQVEETIWSCVERFSDWCKNNACNWFIGSLNIKQCQRHLLKILITGSWRFIVIAQHKWFLEFITYSTTH